MKQWTLNYLLYGLILMGCSFISCQPKDKCCGSSDLNPLDTLTQFNGILLVNQGKLNLDFNNVFQGTQVQLGNAMHINAANDTFTIEQLKYYITNITLIKQDGSQINCRNYNLLDQADPASLKFSLLNVPAGNYVGLNFLVGVDSTMNSSGLQNGALDPSYGMFWTWNTGYIFYRINGRTIGNVGYSFDIGGNGNQAKLQLSLTQYKLKSLSPNLHLNLDVYKMMSQPNLYRFKSDGNIIHTPTDAGIAKLVQNMNSMATLTSID